LSVDNVVSASRDLYDVRSCL